MMDRDDELAQPLAFGSATVNAGKLISRSMHGSPWFNMGVASHRSSGERFFTCRARERENHRHVTCVHYLHEAGGEATACRAEISNFHRMKDEPIFIFILLVSIPQLTTLFAFQPALCHFKWVLSWAVLASVLSTSLSSFVVGEARERLRLQTTSGC